MKTPSFALAAAGGVILVFQSALAQPSSPAPRSIIALQPGVAPAEFARSRGLAPDHVYTHALNGFAVVVPPGLARVLAADPRVQTIEPDQVYTIIKRRPPVPDDPPPAQQTPTGVARVQVPLGTLGMGPIDVDVAVIDTGIDLDHPDLNVVQGRTFVLRTKSADDDNGHGSHVAGTIGALNNDLGVVGVAPGARLWAVKVLDRRGSGWTSDIIAGIEYVTANSGAIEVANMSLGGPASPMLDAAVQNSINAGVVYVVAAGNEADDAARYSPARVIDAITVSAITDTDGLPGSLGPDLVDTAGNIYADDGWALFSNHGEVVDIAAPGVLILSTYKGGGYAEMSGTSMAAPHVAGAAALLRAGDVPADEVGETLRSLGWAQDDPEGFSGDPDVHHEPLLNVGGLY